MIGPSGRRLALVVAGGALGTAARVGLGWALPASDLPWGVLVANLAGAFALGALLTGLTAAAADGVPHRGWRLFLGTGFLGGLTTYSALAVGADALAREGRPAWALAYALGTLAGGLVACWAGGALAAAVARGARRRPEAAGTE